jgi:hypothetical protein
LLHPEARGHVTREEAQFDEGARVHQPLDAFARDAFAAVAMPLVCPRVDVTFGEPTS